MTRLTGRLASAGLHLLCEMGGKRSFTAFAKDLVIVAEAAVRFPGIELVPDPSDPGGFRTLA